MLYYGNSVVWFFLLSVFHYLFVLNLILFVSFFVGLWFHAIGGFVCVCLIGCWLFVLYVIVFVCLYVLLVIWMTVLIG